MNSTIHHTTNSTFYNLADDALIYTISFLSVSVILLLQQVSISQVDDRHGVVTFSVRAPMIPNSQNVVSQHKEDYSNRRKTGNR